MTIESQINSVLKQIEQRKRTIQGQPTADARVGLVTLKLLEDRLADLIAQLPLDAQENNLIEGKQQNNLLIPALIIGAILLL